MERIITDTTGFKRALKTVTDMLTAKEMKEYDLGINLEYKGTTGAITAIHPIEDVKIQAKFEGEEIEEAFKLFFYLEDLSESLKKYRKKEALYIDEGFSTIIFSTEEGMVSELPTDDEEIEISPIKEFHEVSRGDFITSINAARASNKTTYHDSTMTLKFALSSKRLNIFATNFAQIVTSGLVLDKPTKERFEVNLPTSSLTKVRNVIQRGKGKKLRFAEKDGILSLMTDTTFVLFKSDEVQHINLNSIIKEMSWEETIYNFDTETNNKVLDSQYELLRDKEKEKDDEGIEDYKYIYIDVNDADGKLAFTQKETNRYVLTKDMYRLLSKLPASMEVAINEQAIFMNNNTEARRLMVLIPINTI